MKRVWHRDRAGERRRHGLERVFWRVYLHGVLLLVIVGACTWLASYATGASGAWRSNAERLARYVAAQVTPTLDDPARLEAELGKLHAAFQGDLAVYRGDGRLLARAGAAVPSPESAMPSRFIVDHQHLVDDRHRTSRYVVPLRDGEGGAYLVASGQLPHRAADLGLILAAVLVALALGSVPLARAIARPLERLTAAVRRFGEGDLSARSGIRRNDEVGALAQAFDEMAERIDRLLKRDRELMANVSHELKTPLARIRVALELCEDERTQAHDDGGGAGDGRKCRPGSATDLRARLAGIGDDLGELERLVDDVMVMARLDQASYGAAADVPLRREAVSLRDVLEAARARFERRHAAHRLELEAGGQRSIIDADPSLLRRVFDNLLDNAAKHGSSEDGAIVIGVVAAAESVTVEVRDRGPGVEPDDLPRLFEPFFRTDRSRARSTGGAGVGLALCARVVRAHGGTIEARLRDGGGLAVAVQLPLAASTSA